MEENLILKMSREEYDKFMCSTFPELFQDRNKPMSKTCMCWGFDIGAGWYKLLYDLCIKLDFIRQQTGIVIVFDQIKEKFGGGRFYYHIYSKDYKLIDTGEKKIWCDFVELLVEKAERESETICATCGKQYYHDKITIGGWIYDACKDCMISGKRTDRKDIAEELERIEKRKDRLGQLEYRIEGMNAEELNIVEKTCDEIESRTKTIIT